MGKVGGDSQSVRVVQPKRCRCNAKEARENHPDLLDLDIGSSSVVKGS
jgi:hypothetical protein